MPLFKILPLFLSATLLQSNFIQANAQDTTASITVAATTVSSTSDSGATYFPDEKVQLTDSVIASLDDTISNATILSLFDFASNDSSELTSRSTVSCKTFPGDNAWPPELIWNIFDLLLGGRLIKTVPSAASCHRDWPKQYNAADCAYVTSEWTDSYFQ
jgi:hypothetical protein